ncbi:hypothetical protein U1Q18_036699, partial [Sarracenia purpurea var. burkii]
MAVVMDDDLCAGDLPFGDFDYCCWVYRNGIRDDHGLGLFFKYGCFGKNLACAWCVLGGLWCVRGGDGY